ncbi:MULTISPECIES: thiocillin/thiostrepton family thiazolyl peptide [Streptomyces]|jgi:thiazolylpeptide-type bacteriocin precursor|uniref:thiocillin/thiostrepton family thiazolyl peptide n=1 Tax=Streptomyces TaxID=1883 RepID=UPI00099763BB|nr:MULTISPECIES: thiocillin/thiostrepton family thiazolyl peptide [Streptomyces]MDX2918178.1 thiocillin/thiostrepton family thiazolyl peptide [Streptomyces sp. NE06-03C]MDX3605428.1 thiocillin/thiostrepton family thiazolyl peptide [Streptomyces sp. FL06-04B]MDX3734486.1 thiocillin/thiostrepton family thiazolyl peptide [Streptomyces sp. ID01-15D]
MNSSEELDLNALEISDLIDELGRDNETLSQVMAASCVGTACACSSTSSSS